MSITKEQQKLKHQISIKYNKSHGSTSNSANTTLAVNNEPLCELHVMAFLRLLRVFFQF